MMVDPTGRLITYARDGTAVAAITPRVRGGDEAKGDAAPNVVVVPLPMTPWLGSPATRRTGVAAWRHAWRCVGPTSAGGDRQAVALGLAIVERLDEVRSLTFPVSGGTGVIYQVLVEQQSGVLRDPDTNEPYVVVTTLTSSNLRAIP